MKTEHKVLTMFLIVGLILFLIFLTPQGIKNNYLIFNRDSPNLFSSFFSNYTHTGVEHFLNNLLVWLVVGFLFSKMVKEFKPFLFNSLIILLAFPFILSYLTFSLINIPKSQGFSGLLSAFLGYFLIIFYINLRRETKKDLNSNVVWLILLINLLLVSILHGWINLIIVLSIYIPLSAYWIKEDIAIIWKYIQKKGEFISKSKNKYPYYLISFLTLIILFYLPSLIPVELSIGDSMINTLVHYTGYLGGFMLGISVYSLKKQTLTKPKGKLRE